MGQTTTSATPRVVIIGLDALTFDIIDPLMAEGLLPHLASVARRGARGRLESAWLPMSPPVWTTITTGKNPGGHGVFGFGVLRPGTYEIDTVNSRYARVPRVWDMINAHGLSAGVFNVPVTYPPQPLDGYLVGDILTPDVRRTFTYPEPLGAEIHRVAGGYRLWTSQVYSAACQLPYLRELGDLVGMRLGVIEHLLRTQATDFGMFVFMEADWLQHKAWRLLTDPAQRGTPEYRAARDVFVRLDAAVGRLMDAGGPQCNFLILSDHGAGLHDRVFPLNKWLCDQGFLALARTPRLVLKRFLERRRALPRLYGLVSWLRRRIPWLGRFITVGMAGKTADFFSPYADVDWGRTRAYAREVQGQIFVNLTGREPQGIVADGPEREALVADLERRLAAIVDPRTGRPLVREIRRGGDLYRGPFAREAPDLVMVLDDFRCTSANRFGFDVDGYFDEPEFSASGMHRRNGILMACGPAIAPGTRLTGAGVADITPTVLRLMGLPVAAGLDGRPLEEMLTEEFRRANPLRQEAATARRGTACRAPTRASAEQEGSKEELKDKLRDLGYL
jgi:predicted AlkP superfamily phosphohydrolase/phosphomutase